MPASMIEMLGLYSNELVLGLKEETGTLYGSIDLIEIVVYAAVACGH